jgi:hypothetical protein
MVRTILAVGFDLIEAKKELKGEFVVMFDNEEVPFGYRKANMLMSIARDPRISNVEHAKLLPPSWDTIYKLTRLDDGTFADLIEDGTIRPELERNEISKILRLSRVANDEKRILDLLPAAPDPAGWQRLLRGGRPCRCR